MTIKVSEVAGGPYAHEIDAIRDERYRAARMDIAPDFETVFADTEISPGAFAVIADIDKPVELPVGEFVENVVFNVEEEAPEVVAETTEETVNPNYSEATAPEETGTVEGNGETSVESPVVDAPVTDTPLFDEVSTNA